MQSLSFRLLWSKQLRCTRCSWVLGPLANAFPPGNASLFSSQKETEHMCRVLDACLYFDGRRLAALLGYTVKREKTFGEGVPI